MTARKNTSLEQARQKSKKRGPKTSAGKARSSLNALRHGLTTISRHNPIFSPEIIEIARVMCGDEKDPLLYEKALQVAECDVLLAQIRSYRFSLIERLFNPMLLPLKKQRLELKRRRDIYYRRSKLYDEIMAVHPPRGAEIENERLSKLLSAYWYYRADRDRYATFIIALPDVTRVARYERRAWSRRKRAFSEFLSISCQH